MPVSLVFGASGAIGRFLVPRLLGAGHEVVGVSRETHVTRHSRLRWIRADLHADTPPMPDADAVFSVGPLDAFANWFARTSPQCRPRVVAIGSQSAETKHDSADPHERELAARLLAAERSLANAADARGTAWTVLRPTLVYGAGLDRSLMPIVAFARRWRVFPSLVQAHGLRQPVHADDLAAACLRVFETAQTSRHVYGVGGGERLDFSSMLARVRASLPFRVVPLPIPFMLARAGAGLAAHLPGFGAASRSAVQRLGQDLVVDHAAAIADFGWSPRGFHPDASAWIPPLLP
ncbi:MAG: NAD-dependent epimerase/dehydratase family protein [Rhodanobacteraceae bacterium]